MRARYHAAFSVGSGLAAWMLSRSCGLTLGIVIGGIVIDLDHLVDYVAHYGWRLDVRRFFRASYFGEYKRAFLPLHAWELWLLAACAALILPPGMADRFYLGMGFAPPVGPGRELSAPRGVFTALSLEMQFPL